MISRSLFTAVLLASSAMAGPPLTTIQDVLYKADGTRFAGTLTISWTSFEAIDKSAIATQVTTVTVTGGNLWVQLVPTTTAVPAANYTVIYNSDGHIQFTETWAVPSSTAPLRIRDVRIAQSQTGAVSSDSVAPATQESDVAGLISDLGARPLKGPGYAAGRVAVVDSTGSLEGATGDPSDCVHVDGSTGPCGGSPPGFVDGESLSGTVDGVNTTFNLSTVPNPASSLSVYRNGVLQQLGQDYSLNGGSVQFVAAAVPQARRYSAGQLSRFRFRFRLGGNIRHLSPADRSDGSRRPGRRGCGTGVRMWRELPWTTRPSRRGPEHPTSPPSARWRQALCRGRG